MSIRNDVDIRKLKIQVEDLENAVAELTEKLAAQAKKPSKQTAKGASK